MALIWREVAAAGAGAAIGKTSLGKALNEVPGVGRSMTSIAQNAFITRGHMDAATLAGSVVANAYIDMMDSKGQAELASAAKVEQKLQEAAVTNQTSSGTNHNPVLSDYLESDPLGGATVDFRKSAADGLYKAMMESKPAEGASIKAKPAGQALELAAQQRTALNEPGLDIYSLLEYAATHEQVPEMSVAPPEVQAVIFGPSKEYLEGLSVQLNQPPLYSNSGYSTDVITTVDAANGYMKLAYETSIKGNVSAILSKASPLHNDKMVDVGKASSLGQAREAFSTNSAKSAQVLDAAINSKSYKFMNKLGTVAGVGYVALESYNAYTVNAGRDIQYREIAAAGVGAVAEVSGGSTVATLGAIGGGFLGSFIPGPGTLAGAAAGAAAGIYFYGKVSSYVNTAGQYVTRHSWDYFNNEFSQEVR